MRSVGRHLSAATVLCLLAGLTACSESRTFTPVGPSDISARLIQALDQTPFRSAQALSAGRTAELPGGFSVYPDEPIPNFSVVYVFDWLSAANHVTFTIHRRGDPLPRVSGPFTLSDHCSIPPVSGSIMGAPLSRTLCPIVLGHTSSDKPKRLEISFADFGPGDYRVVASHYGSTSETIRWAFFRN